MPVGKLLVAMSVPTMFSMLIQALYNIVDSIFVARFSETALTAVSLAFPLQTLMFSFAIGTGTGICSAVSRRLGAGDEEGASDSAETGFAIEMIFFAVFFFAGLFVSKPFTLLYTSDPQLVEQTTLYAQICLALSAGVFVSIYTEKTIQATGDTIRPMIIQAAGALFNIVADPVLIFGYLGFPAMGVKGAAVATVSGQFLSMILGLFFLKRNRYLKVRFLKPRFRKDTAQDILKVGIPAIIMQGIGTVMTSLMNAILIVYNILAATVFGIYFKLQSFVFLPIFGLNNGLMPVLGFNYGARKPERIFKALRLGLVFALLFMSAGAFVFITFPNSLLGLFNASPAMEAIGRTALTRISLTFPLAAISIILGSLFQSVGDGYLSMIISVVRQLVVLIPAAWILGKLYGLDAVWYSFVFAEIIALAMSLLFYRKEKKILTKEKSGDVHY